MGLTRGASPGLTSALAVPFHAVVLVRIDWPGGVIRVHSGVGDLTWDSATWIGVGGNGKIRLPTEGFGLAQATGLLTIGGLPAEIDDYLDDDVRGKDVDVWFGAVTERAGTVLVADPVNAFSGYIDGMSDEMVATDTGATRSIELLLGSGPSQRSQTSAHHSYEDQITAEPGDTAGRWVKASVAQGSALNW